MWSSTQRTEFHVKIAVGRNGCTTAAWLHNIRQWRKMEAFSPVWEERPCILTSSIQKIPSALNHSCWNSVSAFREPWQSSTPYNKKKWIEQVPFFELATKVTVQAFCTAGSVLFTFTSISGIRQLPIGFFNTKTVSGHWTTEI